MCFSADFTIRRTDRYRLAEALAGLPTDDEGWSLGWGCHHLLLLSATGEVFGAAATLVIVFLVGLVVESVRETFALIVRS